MTTWQLTVGRRCIRSACAGPAGNPGEAQPSHGGRYRPVPEVNFKEAETREPYSPNERPLEFGTSCGLETRPRNVSCFPSNEEKGRNGYLEGWALEGGGEGLKNTSLYSSSRCGEGSFWKQSWARKNKVSAEYGQSPPPGSTLSSEMGSRALTPSVRLGAHWQITAFTLVPFRK